MNAAVSLTYLLKDEEVEIRAGSYDRGSARYEQFVSYVKEHATSEKPSEDNEGATVYTLNEKDVIAWGETDNRNLFETTNKELISYLKSEGYSVKRTETKKNNTVEIMPYGVITTSFEYGEFYLIDETSRIFINSDLLSGKIARLNIYPAVGDDASNLSESQKMRHTSEVTAKIAIKIAPKCS